MGKLRGVNNKRTVAVSVKMSEPDLKKLEAAANKLWPDAVSSRLISRSSMVRKMALIGADSVLGGGEKKKA